MNLENKLIGMAELTHLLGMSRQTIQRMIARGDFPLGLKTSQRARRWLAHEISEWLDVRRSLNASSERSAHRHGKQK